MCIESRSKPWPQHFKRASSIADCQNFSLKSAFEASRTNCKRKKKIKNTSTSVDSWSDPNMKERKYFMQYRIVFETLCNGRSDFRALYDCTRPTLYCPSLHKKRFWGAVVIIIIKKKTEKKRYRENENHTQRVEWWWWWWWSHPVRFLRNHGNSV